MVAEIFLTISRQINLRFLQPRMCDMFCLQVPLVLRVVLVSRVLLARRDHKVHGASRDHPGSEVSLEIVVSLALLVSWDLLDQADNLEAPGLRVRLEVKANRDHKVGSKLHFAARHTHTQTHTSF